MPMKNKKKQQKNLCLMTLIIPWVAHWAEPRNIFYLWLELVKTFFQNCEKESDDWNIRIIFNSDSMRWTFWIVTLRRVEFPIYWAEKQKHQVTAVKNSQCIIHVLFYIRKCKLWVEPLSFLTNSKIWLFLGGHHLSLNLCIGNFI